MKEKEILLCCGFFSSSFSLPFPRKKDNYILHPLPLQPPWWSSVLWDDSPFWRDGKRRGLIVRIARFSHLSPLISSYLLDVQTSPDLLSWSSFLMLLWVNWPFSLFSWSASFCSLRLYLKKQPMGSFLSLVITFAPDLSPHCLFPCPDP